MSLNARHSAEIKCIHLHILHKSGNRNFAYISAPADGTYQATIGQFTALVYCQNYLHAVVIDEAHKFFDRMPSYRPVFDTMKRLQELSCSLLAMSATLTTELIQCLKLNFLHGDNCVVTIQAVQ